MAAVVNRGGATPDPEPASREAAKQLAPSRDAAKLLEMFSAAQPTPDDFMPGVGMPGGADVPPPQGLYTRTLFGPGVWPSESENDMRSKAAALRQTATDHENASTIAKAQSDNVFSTMWTQGAAAAAAEEHYRTETAQHLRLIDAMRFIAGGIDRIADNVAAIKRNMRDANDIAHREIEASFRANDINISPIQIKYRTLINENSASLHTIVAEETAMLSNEFPEAPKLPGDDSSDGFGKDHATGDDPEGATKDPNGSGEFGVDHGTGGDLGQGPPGAVKPNPVFDPLGLGRDQSTPAILPTSPQKPSLPQMPSVPSAPSTGGSSPLSDAASGGMGPLSGLLGGSSPASGAIGTSGLAGSAGNVGNPAAVQSQTAARAMSQGLGGEFGRGLAAGASAAAGGAAPVTPAQPIPQTPATPLAPPPSTTPMSAAPAAASAPQPLSAPAASSSTGGVPAAPAGGAAGGGAPMAPYGSVLPPAAPTAGGTTPAAYASPPPSVAPSGVGAGAPPTGFVPAVRDSAPARIGRDTSMTDLESARAAVADLAAASSAVYPGLQWAVVVSRGPSGMPELWVTTNEGAGYIPHGVFLPRAMPLASGFDPDLDSRWFGWSNPAETVLRAVQARGDVVSAIATTWPQESEMLRAASQDVAIGVAPAGGPAEAQASTLTRGRSHRLETVDPALYHELSAAEKSVVDAYARQVTQEVAFSGGPELSLTAQSVARALISGRWPSDAEWSALRTEYDSARLMAGSQHPGLIGIEEGVQLLTYHGDFLLCRRIETLLCWNDAGPADVVYAARAAGVVLPLAVNH